MIHNSWAVALGALAVGLPVLIHWLTRPRPVRFPLSTLRFVREAVQQRRARHRLRDIIILALRTMAVLLLAAAVARPLIGQMETVAVDENVDVVRVVLLDVSQSMAAETRGIQTFERARIVASENLEYRSGLKVNLILAAARPRGVFQTPSTNFAALADELGEVTVRPQRLNVQTALNMAADMLAHVSNAADVRRELVVVSDFQRSNWSNADFSTFPQDTKIQLESVAADEAPPNLGILRVAIRGRAEIGREVGLDVDIGNYSPTPRLVRVEVALGDAVYQLEGACAPNSKTTLSAQILPRSIGWQVGEARLLATEDAMPADDVRPCALEVRPPPIYALITRQPEQKRPSSSYYLQRALDPIEARSGKSKSRIVRVSPANFDRETIGPAELIVLDHPGRLSSETINLLASLLRRGRGVLYVVSEPVDATNLKQLTKAAGAALQMPVEFAPAPVGQPRRNLFLTEVRREQPPFQIFGDNLTSLIGELRFSGGLTSRRLEGTLRDDILATYSDRSAFLVATSTDAGSLVVLNADLGASNLPASPMFVPLLGELVQHCLLSQARNTNVLACGDPLAVYLPPGLDAVEQLHLHGPDSSSDAAGELTQETTGVLWHADSAGPPGVSQVKRDGRTVFALVTAIPAEESDLRTLSANVFQERLSGGRSVQFRSVRSSYGDENDDLWTWLAIACMTCLLGEVVALKLFRT